jgi:ATP-dependent Lhr-like helicase
MGTKRGVQTELGLAALRRFAPAARTWGLSATLGNLEEAMQTLLGIDQGIRPRHLVHADLPKSVRLDTILPPRIERFPWAGHIGTRLLSDVIQAIHDARSTLVFTNTRSQAESWFQSILTAAPDLLGEVALHHGSLDRWVRTEVESMLRDGRLRAVVCTSSLDLGVDFTPVEQVIQIGSPKGIARALQRAGRSGHQPGALSRLVGVPTNALEIVEFAAAREAMSTRRVESRPALDRPMDVLVQHLVTRALGGGFDEAALREEVRTTHAYSRLRDEEWSWAMDFVCRGGRALTAYPQYARVEVRDGRCEVASPRLARLHRMSIGTITSDPSVAVRFHRGGRLGTIEESFVSRLRPGDRFVFAGRVVELVRFRDMTATVRASSGVRGTIPRWMGGKSPLSSQLAAAVRRKLDEGRRGAAAEREMQLVAPLLELQAAWSIVPGPDELLLEHARSRDGYHVFVFPLEGRLVHEGLGALLAHRLTRRTARSVTVSGNDYGVELLSPTPLPTGAEDWRELLEGEGLLEDLLACVNSSELARRRFRDIARIAGLIFPGYPGQPKALRHLQASSELFYEVFSEFDPGNLLLDQARREVLERELEVKRMRAALERLAEQTLQIVETRPFTPLAFPLWAERMRSQHVSSERWTERIERMAASLEERAGSCDRATA